MKAPRRARILDDTAGASSDNVYAHMANTH